MQRSQTPSVRYLIPRAVLACSISFGALACHPGDRPDGSADVVVAHQEPSLDLLIVVKNHVLTAIGAQPRFLSALGSLLDDLSAPLCIGSDGAACPCGAECPTTLPSTSIHVGVLSTDLSTAGVPSVGACSAGEPDGDDANLNPVRFGAAFADRAGSFDGFPDWYLPTGISCERPNALPSFLSFDSTSDAAEVACMAAVWSGGCRLAQPLEVVSRAFVETRAAQPDVNAGFLRPDSVLAILVVSAEDDVSVRNCAHSSDPNCVSAIDSYDATSTQWASDDPWLRFQLFVPGSAQDPTWSIDRYIDPHDASAGWLSLKPAHPERIVFGAITGVPLRGWQRADDSIDWDALLGRPSHDRDDFDARDTTTAIQGMSAEGPISMRPTEYPPCGSLIPACYLEGTTYDAPAYCLGESGGMRSDYAAPSRRLVETARRFDESAVCGGSACRNGFVESACRGDYRPFLQRFAHRVREQLARASAL